MILDNQVISLNPATGERIFHIEKSTPDEVKEIIDAANNATTSWSSIGIERRSAILQKVAEVIKSKKDELARMLTEEMGKPLFESEMEIDDAINTIAYFAKAVQSLQETIELDCSIFPDTTGKVCFIPYGTIGIISPWNYPISTPAWSIVPALFAGNSVVFKPSEHTTRIGLEFVKCFHEGDVPKDILAAVKGGGDVGQEVVAGATNKIFFTGSISTANKIAKKIIESENVKPYEFELGGKDPFIVCEDANLDIAVPGAVWGAMGNAGQVCTSAERVYVHERIANEFIKRVCVLVRKLRVGNGLDRNVDVGPLITDEQRQKVQKKVERAVSQGAQVLASVESIPKRGFFFAPTVLRVFNNSMEIMQDETFGPVMPIIVVKDIDQAIELANDSRYGLGATVWTRDLERGERICKQLKVGMTWINDINLAFPGADYWGGIRGSGLGSASSKLLQCLTRLSIMTYKGENPRSWYFPYK